MKNHLQKITWIAFDYGGTLAEVSPPVDVDAMYTVLREDFNIDVPYDFKELFRIAIEEGVHKARKTSIEHPLVFYLKDVLSELNLIMEFPLENIVNRFFHVIGDGIPYPDAKSVLNTLYEEGYSLLLAANTLRNTATREKTLELAGLKGFFRHLILSSEVGYRKPHKRFYECLIRKAGVSPRKIVYVGDALDKDVIAPANMGMCTIWVHNSACRVMNIPNYIGQAKTVSEILEMLL